MLHKHTLINLPQSVDPGQIGHWMIVFQAVATSKASVFLHLGNVEHPKNSPLALLRISISELHLLHFLSDFLGEAFASKVGLP